MTPTLVITLNYAFFQIFIDVDALVSMSCSVYLHVFVFHIIVCFGIWLVPDNIVFWLLMFWKRVFQSKWYKLHNVVWKYANVEAPTCVLYKTIHELYT